MKRKSEYLLHTNCEMSSEISPLHLTHNLKLVHQAQEQCVAQWGAGSGLGALPMDNSADLLVELIPTTLWSQAYLPKD